MYKIYINETPLFLINKTDLEKSPSSSDTTLIARYGGKPKLLLSYIDMLEKSQRFQAVYLYHDDVEVLFGDFQSRYKLISAAGGLVFNKHEEILLIYRLGYWDLPKGKIEEGEVPEAAAIREVQEETGLSAIDLGPFIGHTYHTYRSRKGKRILKRTYWYQMNTPEMDLIPQREEDIEVAEWSIIASFMAQPKKTYGNIKDILDQYMASAKS